MTITVYQGDCLAVLPTLAPDSVQCVVTSPPYLGLRDFNLPPSVWDDVPGCPHAWGPEERGRRQDLCPREASRSSSRMGTDARQGIGPPTGGHFCQHCHAWRGALGLEPDPRLYVQHLVQTFAAVKRVLRPDGIFFCNIADTYANDPKWGGRTGGKHVPALHGNPGGNGRAKRTTGLPHKSLCLIPQRLAIALQDDGWVLRQVFPWIKRNSMPSSQRDRPTSALEWWLMCTKMPHYFSDMQAVRRPGRDWGPRNRSTNKYHTEDLRKAGQSPHRGLDNGDATNGRTYRNTDLWVQSLAAPYGLVGVGDELVGLDVPTRAGSGGHYATFSVQLVTPLLQMATSLYGACGTCGSPYRRVTVRSGGHDWHQDTMIAKGIPGEVDGTGGNKRGQSSTPLNTTQQVQTTGWAATCACPAVPRRRCVALDPFAGRGTVGLAAERLGLDAVLIEMNPTDITHTCQRLQADAPLLAHINGGN